MNNKQNRLRLLFGVVLVLLGILFLFGEFVEAVFQIRITHYTWPFIILIPGALLFLMAFITDEKASRVLLFFGSLFSAVGLLLFVQNLTGWWATWAYAWALIFPTSVGIGQMLYGLLRKREDLLREGWRLTKIGLTILLVGVVFFELLLGISGFGFFGLRSFCFPAVLVFLGLVFILRTLMSGRRSAIIPPMTPPPARPDAVMAPQPSHVEEPPSQSGPVEWESSEKPAQDEE